MVQTADSSGRRLTKPSGTTDLAYDASERDLINTVGMGTVVINDGQTFPANSIDGKDLPAIPPTQPITLDVTTVGITFPGERLVVSIRL